jgi:hypothetical protein
MSNNLPKDVLPFLDLMNNPLILNPKIDKEGKSYSACSFSVLEKNIIFRTAKKTPTKIGFFVTLWKRLYKESEIESFEESDPVDFVVIKCNDPSNHGYFIFPKNVLVIQKVFSSSRVNGKRALRIYPPSCEVLNDQAKKTQRWQSPFYAINKDQILSILEDRHSF